jgi:hypothetical protein
MGIRDPASYIVGRPLDVTAKGTSTFVTGEIARSRDGSFDPQHNRYDEFWASLLRDPPVIWYASIFGYPTDYESCKSAPGECAATGAKRLLIKAIDWRSLAFTRTPKNTALSNPTRIISAKAHMIELAKSYMVPGLAMANNMQDVWAHKACAKCNVHEAPSLLGYRHHFAKCCGHPEGIADINAHAMMYRRQMDKFMGPQHTTSPAV